MHRGGHQLAAVSRAPDRAGFKIISSGMSKYSASVSGCSRYAASLAAARLGRTVGTSVRQCLAANGDGPLTEEQLERLSLSPA